MPVKRVAGFSKEILIARLSDEVKSSGGCYTENLLKIMEVCVAWGTLGW